MRKKPAFFSGLLLRAASTLTLLACGAALAHAQDLRFNPPAVASLKCDIDAPVAGLDRDWSTWKGEDTGLTSDQLYEIGRLLTVGSGAVDADAATARRVLEKAIGQGSATRPVRQALAKAIVAGSTDKAEIQSAIKLLEDSVAERDLGAALALGQLYERGKVVPRSPEKALTYFRIGAAAGDAMAQLGIARLARSGAVPGMSAEEAALAGQVAVTSLLVDVARGQCEAAETIGRLYQTGDILPLDAGLAARWYVLAARAARHAKAAESAAWLYANGAGVELSTAMAAEMLQIAAAGGRPRAMVALGQAFALGDGLARDNAKAIFWFEKAVRARQTVALRWLVRAWRGEFGGTPDLAKAFIALKQSVERPNPERKAVFELGEAYLSGTGTQKDIVAAIRTLERGAAIGSDDAANLLGNILEFGQGVAPDPVRAARYYRLAASLGSVSAMTSLAEMHRCGRGVEWSPELARRWVERAAFKGSGASMLRYTLTVSADTPEDAARRFRLLRRAAALGSREAMAQVSLAYSRGEGVTADQAQAQAWRAKALAAGDDAARGYIAFATELLSGEADETSLAAAQSLLESGAAQKDPRGSYELSRFLTERGETSGARRELEEAAIAGYPPAMRALAHALSEGERVGDRDAAAWLAAAEAAGDLRSRIERATADPETARPRLDQVADAGVCTPIELAEVAAAYLKLPADTDDGRGKIFLDRAIASAAGDKDALYLLADVLLRGTEPETLSTGLSLMQKAAEAGLAKAMRRLARGYADGLFGAVDPVAAQVWLEKAAARGDAKSAVDFAKFVARLEKPDPAMVQRAHEMLVRIAERTPEAARQLGQLALGGSLGLENRNEAARWFMMAASRGDSSSMRALSRLYSSGDGGVERDPGQALAWMKRAAEAGEKRAMLDLAAAYEAGFGAAADPALAADWFARAKVGGADAVARP